MKAELAAISYSCLFKQIVKTSANQQSANNKLYALGRDMGQHIADQFNNSQSSYLSPAETIKSMLKAIILEYFAVQLNLQSQDIQYLKGKHLYNLKYSVKDSQSPLTNFINLPQQYKQLNYYSLLNGFLLGILQTMGFYGEVILENDGLRDPNIKSCIYIRVQKYIKQED